MKIGPVDVEIGLQEITRNKKREINASNTYSMWGMHVARAK